MKTIISISCDVEIAKQVKEHIQGRGDLSWMTEQFFADLVNPDREESPTILRAQLARLTEANSKLKQQIAVLKQNKKDKQEAVKEPEKEVISPERKAHIARLEIEQKERRKRFFKGVDEEKLKQERERNLRKQP